MKLDFNILINFKVKKRFSNFNLNLLNLENNLTPIEITEKLSHHLIKRKI